MIFDAEPILVLPNRHRHDIRPFHFAQQLLDHMNESAVYSEPDLRQFKSRLDQLHHLIREDTASGRHPEAMTRLLERKLNDCGTSSFLSSRLRSCFDGCGCDHWVGIDAIVESMEDSLSELPEELYPIHQKLVQMRRQLVALGAKPKPAKAELKTLVEELRKIDA